MTRVPAPGISYIKEEAVTLRGPKGEPGERLSAGMTNPSVMDDGWWLTHLWVADGEGVVDAATVAPAAGPPPGTPLATLGPRVAGSLSGLIAEEDGRQLIRLRMPEAPDESRPWERPLLCMVAIRWDPVRASVITRNQLARELLRGFAAAVEGLGRPG
ncbi:MAG TPA: hypothetical protein VMZ33_00115 [Candidatus Limnocylindrales bacterium]|nr:hypothetical protein [Candidatus Limnocylindrales bacterium]